ELSQKEMVSIERSPTSANPENSQEGSFLQASDGAGGVVYHHSTRHHKNTDTGVGHGVISGFRI
ncbi:hypothetical protein ACQKEG_13830, partial [Klebsiella quasipneumoniae]